MFDFVLLGFCKIYELFIYMFVSFYAILKQSVKNFCSRTPTNFTYEPPLPFYIRGIFLVYVDVILLFLYSKLSYCPLTTVCVSCL
jgi:hypothetical protein